MRPTLLSGGPAIPDRRMEGRPSPQQSLSMNVCLQCADTRQQKFTHRGVRCQLLFRVHWERRLQSAVL